MRTTASPCPSTPSSGPASSASRPFPPLHPRQGSIRPMSQMSRALDVLADVLQNSIFSEDMITRVRDVILRAMNEVGKEAEEVIFNHLHTIAFQYTPLGHTTLGPAANIRTITKAHLQNYIRTHYAAPRMVVAAAGAVKNEYIVEQVKKLFTKLSTDPTTASELVAKKPE